MTDKILILLFSIEVSAILLFLSYKLTTGRHKKWYKKSPRFYLATNILIIFTLLNVVLLNIKEFFVPEKIFYDFFSVGSILSFLLLFYIWGLFLSGALGFIWVGIKSIRDKDSITPGPQSVNKHKVVGTGAVVAGIFYLVAGLIFLFGVLYTGTFIFLGINN